MECCICKSAFPGNNYVENCCRPCSAFFRRTTQLRLRYRCKKNGRCESRFALGKRLFCRFCRLKKCIEAGMKDPEDPSVPLRQFLDNFDFLQEENIFTPEYVIHNREKFIKLLGEKVDDILKEKSVVSLDLSLSQQAADAYIEHQKSWHLWSTDNGQNTIDDYQSQEILCCDIYRDFPNIARFCMKISPFAELALHQKSFFGRFCVFDRLFATTRRLGRSLDDSRTFFHRGNIVDCTWNTTENECLLQITQDFYVEVLMKPFKRLDPTQFELMYIFLNCLFGSGLFYGSLSKETMGICENIRERIAEELGYHYNNSKGFENQATRIYKIHNLLSAVERLEEKRTQVDHLARTFGLKHTDFPFHDVSLWK